MATSKKATFLLPVEVLAAIDRAVATGSVRSKNAFVEKAIVDELEEIRREQRRARWRQAAKDPLFMKDLEDIEKGFAIADAETARQIR